MHTNEQWTKSTDKEKSEKWKWARRSAEVKEVKKMEEELKQFMNSVADLATETKKKKKLRQNEKLMIALEKCKQHGGPITLIDIEKLNKLTEEQVKSEVAYQLTTGPGIRYKRNVVVNL